ncbi:Methyltransferase domain-containing protein [Tranquillimonas rosea]|uniref:Methyltransferase domain-containing protein n=1 Tax=Tranquillimonas rosea TaxID=641238 RepID=A0A1H9WTX8_9RHOB|nr:class I SAM-dependent methyltransferase [Tranquillimonas rosea]SES37392.1 Methyltransferase domain-containing protein [Tranquillimonas rosea]
MSTTDPAKSLDVVYSAKDVADVAKKYDDWAERYDTEMSTLGYRHPNICLAMLTRHLPRGDGPVLDAGAGTGLLGEWMHIVGYDGCEALDISEKMLEVAKRKQVYNDFHVAALGESLALPDDRFAAIVAAGVFTVGHVGAEGFDELIRVTRPGGIIVVTIKDTLYNGEVGARMRELADSGVWEIVEETPPYVSMPHRPDTVPSRAVVLKVK